jgi:hypothetical protein
MRKFVFAALVAALVLPVAASQAAPAAKVISGLTYDPKPLYDDDFVVAVTFRASRPAKAGYEWAVVFSISGAEPIGACSSLMLSFDPAFGGSRKHHRKAGRNDIFLRANRYGDRFCKGRGSIHVAEHRIGSQSIGRPLGPGSSLFSFRILGA